MKFRYPGYESILQDSNTWIPLHEIEYTAKLQDCSKLRGEVAASPDRLPSRLASAPVDPTPSRSILPERSPDSGKSAGPAGLERNVGPSKGPLGGLEPESDSTTNTARRAHQDNITLGGSNHAHIVVREVANIEQGLKPWRVKTQEVEDPGNRDDLTDE